MKVTHDIPFDVELSENERTAIEKMLDGKCEAQKVARLTVTVIVTLADKLPTAPTK